MTVLTPVIDIQSRTQPQTPPRPQPLCTPCRLNRACLGGFPGCPVSRTQVTVERPTDALLADHPDIPHSAFAVTVIRESDGHLTEVVDWVEPPQGSRLGWVEQKPLVDALIASARLYATQQGMPFGEPTRCEYCARVTGGSVFCPDTDCDRLNGGRDSRYLDPWGGGAA